MNKQEHVAAYRRSKYEMDHDQPIKYKPDFRPFQRQKQI